jgi:hypothetical protein
VLSDRHWRDCRLRRNNGLRRALPAFAGRGVGVVPVEWWHWFCGACLRSPMPLFLCGCLRCGTGRGRCFKRQLIAVFGRVGRNGYVICDCMSPYGVLNIGIPRANNLYLAPRCYAASYCLHRRPSACRPTHLPRPPVASLDTYGQIHRPIYAPIIRTYTR